MAIWPKDFLNLVQCLINIPTEGIILKKVQKIFYGSTVAESQK